MLDKNPGASQGTLGVKTVSNTTLKQLSGFLVGYSANFRNGQTAGAVANCKIIKVLHDLFLHDCDAGRGSSVGSNFAY